MKTTATFLLTFLLAAILPAQISIYGSPAYGYTANGTLTQISAIGQGAYNFPPGSIYAVRDTLNIYTNNYGTTGAYVIMGLNPDNTPTSFGQTILVRDIITTELMSPLGGSYYEWSIDFDDPALVGLNLYFQCAHLWPSGANPYNDFVLSNGVWARLQ